MSVVDRFIKVPVESVMGRLFIKEAVMLDIDKTCDWRRRMLKVCLGEWKMANVPYGEFGFNIRVDENDTITSGDVMKMLVRALVNYWRYSKKIGQNYIDLRKSYAKDGIPAPPKAILIVEDTVGIIAWHLAGVGRDFIVNQARSESAVELILGKSQAKIAEAEAKKKIDSVNADFNQLIADMRASSEAMIEEFQKKIAYELTVKIQELEKKRKEEIDKLLGEAAN